MGRDRLMRELLRERFLWTLKSGEAFEGLLHRFDATTVEVEDAFAVTTDSRVSVDGTIYLPRSEIAYFQRIGHVPPGSP